MKALLLIDIQNDFLPGGSLAVKSGDQVIEFANQIMGQYEQVIATQDWHPADHLSFASQHDAHQVGELIELEGLSQVLWPDHCIQGTPGAEFSQELNTMAIKHVVQKGTDRKIDSYSGFFDNAKRKATGLHELLQQLKVSELDMVGLATDYCVKFTALDAVELGYKTTVFTRGVRGVELQEGDCEKALTQMQSQGVTIANN